MARTTANGLGLTYTRCRKRRSRRVSVGIEHQHADAGLVQVPDDAQFSVSFARRIPFDMVLEAAYVGTRGRDLVTRVNGNAFPKARC